MYSKIRGSQVFRRPTCALYVYTQRNCCLFPVFSTPHPGSTDHLPATTIKLIAFFDCVVYAVGFNFQPLTANSISHASTHTRPV